MRISIFFFLFLLFFLPAGSVNAQLSVTQGSAMGLTPLELVQSQLVGQGITVSNAYFNSASGSITSDQIGYFTASNQAALELGI
jgi:hypothetical protein